MNSLKNTISPILITLSFVSAGCALKKTAHTETASQVEARNPASVDPAFGTKQFTIGREDCVTIKPFPNTEPDADAVKDEEKMCKIHFEDSKLALCPATYSSNPATEVHELPLDTTRSTFESTQCKKPQQKTGKKIAKFKQSTSCSHTSSILAYNKLAQALNVHLEVPVAVYRSMELQTHRPVQEMSKIYTKGLIARTWKTLIHEIDANNSKVIKNGFLYGALLEGVGGETKHPRLNKVGSTNRAAPFIASPTWSLATNAKPIREIIAPKLEKLAAFIEVRDASEMALLDHIMAQQDRFGNVAARPYIYWMSNDEHGVTKVDRMKQSKAIKPLDKNDPSKKSFLDTLKENKTPHTLVQRMILKDNDCGLRSSENDVRKNAMLANLRHMGPSVYLATQKLAAQDSQLMLDYLQRQLLMSKDEANGVWDRLKEAAAILKKNCKENKLKLDLEVDSFLGVAPAPIVSCD